MKTPRRFSVKQPKLDNEANILALLNDNSKTATQKLEALFTKNISAELQTNPQIFNKIGEIIEKASFAEISEFVRNFLVNGQQSKKYEIQTTAQIARLLYEGATFLFQKPNPEAEVRDDTIIGYLAQFFSTFGDQAQNMTQKYIFIDRQAITRMVRSLVEERLPSNKTTLKNIITTLKRIGINQEIFPYAALNDGSFDVAATENNEPTHNLLDVLHQSQKISREKLLLLYGCGFEFKKKDKDKLPDDLKNDTELNNLLFDTSFNNIKEYFQELHTLGALEHLDVDQIRERVKTHFLTQDPEAILESLKTQEIPAEILAALIECNLRPKDVTLFFSTWSKTNYTLDDQILILESAVATYRDSHYLPFLSSLLKNCEQRKGQEKLDEELKKGDEDTPELKDKAYYYTKLTEAIEGSNHELVRLFRKAGFFDYESKELNDNFYQLLEVITNRLRSIINKTEITSEDKELHAQLLPFITQWVNSPNVYISSEKREATQLLLDDCAPKFNPSLEAADIKETNSENKQQIFQSHIITICTKDTGAKYQELDSYLKEVKINLNKKIPTDKVSGLEYADCLTILLHNNTKFVTPRIIAILLDHGLKITPDHRKIIKEKIEQGTLNPQIPSYISFWSNPNLLINRIKEEIVFAKDGYSKALSDLVTDNIKLLEKHPKYHDDLILFMIKHHADPALINSLVPHHIKLTETRHLPLIEAYKDEYEQKFSDRKDQLNQLFNNLKIENEAFNELLKKYSPNKKNENLYTELLEKFIEARTFLDSKSYSGNKKVESIKKILDNKFKISPLNDDFITLYKDAIINNNPVFTRAVRQWAMQLQLTDSNKEKLKNAIKESVPILSKIKLEFDNIGKNASEIQKQKKQARDDISSDITAMMSLLDFTAYETKEYTEQLNLKPTKELEEQKIFKEFIEEIKKGKKADEQKIRELLTEKIDQETTTIEDQFHKDFGSDACLIDFLLKHQMLPKLIATITKEGKIKPKITIADALVYEESYKGLGEECIKEFYNLLESEFTGDKAMAQQKRKATESQINEIRKTHLYRQLDDLVNKIKNGINDDDSINNNFAVIDALFKTNPELLLDEEVKDKYKNTLENLIVLSAEKPSTHLFDKSTERYTDHFGANKKELQTKVQEAINDTESLYQNRKVDIARPEKHIQFLENIAKSFKELEENANEKIEKINDIRTKYIEEFQQQQNMQTLYNLDNTSTSMRERATRLLGTTFRHK